MPLKAVILVGGYGTRLRPLTFTTPKPIVEFANKPICLHQIEALVAVGVKEIVLAVNVEPARMTTFMKDVEAKYNIKCHFSKEDVPLGTAGPLALAKKYLAQDKDPFFMFNSDVICEFPLKDMLDFHTKSKAEGTIFVTPVKDPSKYGVVLFDDKGKISDFVEKPQEWVGDKINAGIYLFDTAVLDRIELKPTSIEREIFPQIAGDGKLFAMNLPGYWMDIGQPKDYLRGMVLHLKYMSEEKKLEKLPDDVTVNGSVLVDPSVKFGKGCVIGPDVVLGPGVTIGDGVRLERTTVLGGATINNYSWIKNSIIGWESRVGQWCHLDWNVCGADVKYSDGITVNGATVCPHKGVKADVHEPKIIL